MIFWVLYVSVIVQGYNYTQNCMYISGIITNINVSIFLKKSYLSKNHFIKIHTI